MCLYESFVIRGDIILHININPNKKVHPQSAKCYDNLLKTTQNLKLK